jgi:hypothetical protein
MGEPLAVTSRYGSASLVPGASLATDPVVELVGDVCIGQTMAVELNQIAQGGSLSDRECVRARNR